jgi:hypothetical protein
VVAREKGRERGESYYYLNQVSTKIFLRANLKTVHPKCSQVIKKFIFFLIMNFYKELQKKNVCCFFSLYAGLEGRPRYHKVLSLASLFDVIILRPGLFVLCRLLFIFLHSSIFKTRCNET